MHGTASEIRIKQVTNQAQRAPREDSNPATRISCDVRLDEALAHSEMYEAIVTREKENLYKVEHTHATVYVETVSCDEDVTVEEATLDTYSYKLQFERSGKSCDIDEIIDPDRSSRGLHETSRRAQEAAF